MPSSVWEQSGQAEEAAVCALEMEKINWSPLRGSKKVDSSCDGSISRNGGDSAEVSVPLSQRPPHMDREYLHRLHQRNVLLEHKKRLCTLALCTAMLGILLMIIHAEICSFTNSQVRSRH